MITFGLVCSKLMRTSHGFDPGALNENNTVDKVLAFLF
jgi:hypothetical protein